MTCNLSTVSLTADKIAVPATTGWTKPEEWPDISNVKDGEINLLLSNGAGVVFHLEVDDTSKTYSVDWGDGTVDNILASTAFEPGHIYTEGIGGTYCTELGYWVYKVRIYSAANLTRFYIKRHPVYLTGQAAPILWAIIASKTITSMDSMFSGTSCVASLMQSCQIKYLDSCITVAFAFRSCTALTELILPSSWGSVQNATSMLDSCGSLVKVNLPSSWGNITKTISMMNACKALSSVELPSSWGNVDDVSNMFLSCSSLIKIKLPSSWGNVLSTSYMLNYCTALSIVNLPKSWGKVINASNMLQYTLIKRVEFTDWGINGSVTNVTFMLGNCIALTEVVLPDSVSSITAAGSFLSGCYSLKTVSNLGFLGSLNAECDLWNLLNEDEIITGSLVFASKIKQISITGTSSIRCKINGLRLVNPNSTFGTGAPQISVAYTSLSKEALAELFNDLPTGLTSKTINITGATGNDTISVSTTIASGAKIATVASTSSIQVGMELVNAAAMTVARSVTFTEATSTVNRAAHGMYNGKKICFKGVGSVTTISVSRPYFVVNVTTDTFQVSLTEGGDPVTFIGSGSGNFVCVPTVLSIDSTTQITIDVPAYAGLSSAATTFSLLKKSIAILKGWSVTG